MKTKEERLKEIQEIAEQLQDDCHSMVDAIIKEKDKQVGYQDAVNTWLFLQLAKLKYDLEELKDIIQHKVDI